MRILSLICLLLAAGISLHAATIYVDAHRSTGDGTTWQTAFPTLQQALARARPGDEIWVAAGTYRLHGPDATFQLKTGVALYGGFTGDESSRSQRDWRKNASILDGNGACHVVTGADRAILDGFTVTGGNGLDRQQGGPPGGFERPRGRFPGAPGEGRNGIPGRRGERGGGRGGIGGPPIHTSPQEILSGINPGFGAGMVNFQVAPTVRNCVFENNKAGKGGAVYNMTCTEFPPRPGGSGKTPVFVNCVFRHNFAQGRGGGVSNDLGTAPVFLNCVFAENSTAEKGGGMYNDFGSSPTLVNCLFTGNKAKFAAGMGNDGGSCPVLYFCTFSGNHATDTGPSLYQGTGPANDPSVIDCLFSGNICDWGSTGIYNWHDDTPFIKASSGGDAGYRAGRFSEAQLPRLLDALKPYRAQPVRESPTPPARQRIPSSNRIVFVDAANAGRGDGRSWKSAYASLQEGLSDAGRDGAEVLVAAGTYRLGADRSSSFVLRPGVRVYGGYRYNERNPGKYPSVLDGNHAYHVVTGANGAVLDGFTITGGYADGLGYDGQGGGLIDYRRGPQVRPKSQSVSGFTMSVGHCIFTKNYAHDGGAVYSYDRGRPTFTACLFVDNRAENGGAVLDRVGVESTFTGCEFIGNAARWRGGAVYFDYGSRPTLTGCTFRNNTTGGHGGAVFSLSRASQLGNTTVALTHCSFEDNSAKGYGGAADFDDNTIAVVDNCTFRDNRAGLKGTAIAVTGNSTLQSQNNALPDTAVYEEPPTGPRARGGGRFPGPMGSGTRRPAGPSGVGGPAGPMGFRARRPIGPFGYRTRRDDATGTFQPSADFSVITVGTGSPQYNPERSGPCSMIQFHGHYILVDMGNGTQARLHEAGIRWPQIDALMLTHHHLDHNEEFMPIYIYTHLTGRTVPVIGPPRTQEYVDFTRKFYAPDIAYRLERRGRTMADFGKSPVREVLGGESFQLDGMKVTVAKVNHTIYTVGYRFDAEGKSIVISGDTSYSDNLIKLARSADVLVMDSGGAPVREGRERGAAGGDFGGGRADPLHAHSSRQEVCEMAQRAGVKELVLTHIGPGRVDDAATRRALAQGYSGVVVVAHDLMEVVPGAPPPTESTEPPNPQFQSQFRPRDRQGFEPRFIRRLDRNGDGKVSRAEFDGPPDRFSDFDKNGDGFITPDEAPQGPPPGRRGGM